MDNLIIINRKPEQLGFESIGSEPSSIWKTCLRQILFTTPDQIENYNLFSGDEVYNSEKAFSFLCEVLCGLHSPVFGETEVFGQFKLFIEQQTIAQSTLIRSNIKWIQFLNELVKNIRTEYITGLGSNSYGSTLRKLTRDTETLSILGAGQLATEILPWISKNKKIQILVRNAEKYETLMKTYKELKVENLNQTIHFNQALIIAAPIENADLITLINNSVSKPDFIYDLRNNGYEDLSKNLKNIKMLSLSDFFQIFNADKIKFDHIKKEIKKDIHQRALEFSLRSEIRPKGWDDLC